MRKQIVNIGVTLLMVSVLVAAGVAPLTSQAAAKKTTYSVVLQKNSWSCSLSSVNDGAASETANDFGGISFKMVVEEKAKKDKSGSYYPVTIPEKTFKGNTSEQKMPGGTTAVTTTTMTKDSKGMLYFGGGAVDISSVMGEKKLTTTIGGAMGPANSLVITMNMQVTSTIKETGKAYLKMPVTSTVTTGTAKIVAQGAKGLINGKVFPDNDTLKLLPNPLVGKPLDFSAGTGTLVTTSGTTNLKSGIGSIDRISAAIWIITISK